MRFVNPLPLVRDMAASRAFYRDVLGLDVLEDHGTFVRFAGGFALHEGESLLAAALGHAGNAEPYGRDNLVLYFETDDLQAAFGRIAGQAMVVHGIEVQSWGGRVFRVRDPDGHLVEVGEPMGAAA